MICDILNEYKALHKNIYILFLARIIISLGSFVSPLLTLILIQKLGYSASETGMIVAVNIILQAPSLVLGGKLADIIGRKKVIFISQTFSGILFFLLTFLKLDIFLVFCFIIASNFLAVSTPAYDALVADLTKYEERKVGFSLLYIGVNIGYAVAPIIAGFLYKDYLLLVFLGNSVTTFFSAFLIQLFVEEPKLKYLHESRNIKVQNNSMNNIKVTIFTIIKHRPILIWFSLIMIIYSFVYSQWSYAIPLQFCNSFKELGAKYYGIAAGLNGIIVILLTPIILHITRNISCLKVIAIGGVLYSISFGAFGFSSRLKYFLIYVFIMTLGEILVTINSRTFISYFSPVTHMGRISAIMPLIYGIGYAIGPFFMGIFITYIGLSLSWIIISLFSIIGAALVFLISLKEKFRNIYCYELNKD